MVYFINKYTFSSLVLIVFLFFQSFYVLAQQESLSTDSVDSDINATSKTDTSIDNSTPITNDNKDGYEEDSLNIKGDEIKPGMNLSLGLGFLHIRSNDNLTVLGDEEGGNEGDLNDIQAPPDDRQITNIPIGSVELRYRPQFQPNVYFIASIGESDVGGIAKIGLGYSFNEDFNLEVSLDPLTFDDFVWEDPYATDRKSTGISTDYNINIVFEALLVELSYYSAKLNIENDVIGEMEESLRRDRVVTEYGSSFNIPLWLDFEGDNSTIIALAVSADYIDNDAVGGANSFSDPRYGLGLFIKIDNFNVLTQYRYENHEYNEVHPIYGRKRVDNINTVFMLLGYSNLFKDNLQFNLIVVDRENTSNIDFFNNQITLVGITAKYEFGAND